MQDPNPQSGDQATNATSALVTADAATTADTTATTASAPTPESEDQGAPSAHRENDLLAPMQPAASAPDAASHEVAALAPSSSAPSASPQDAEEPMPSFAELGVSESLRAAIDKIGWAMPTRVQAAAFGPLAAGKDLMVQSRTGSGKTGAFCLPWLETRYDPRPARETGVQLLVLLPTRELAKQVCDELVRLSDGTEIRPLPVYGGTAMQPQLDALAQGVHAVVGTPGRILDHLRRRSLNLSKVGCVVLDECDEMLSMGFLEDIRAILEACPAERQTCLFSATLPPDIARIAKRYMRAPERIELSNDGISAAEIQHRYYSLSGLNLRPRDLLDVIMVEDPASAIVFCNTREDTRVVASTLQRAGYDAEALSSDLTQSAREHVMGLMREQKLRFLVATDIAARGIDISHVSHVFNFALPESSEVYVHRTGRTGRAGRRGVAISLLHPQDIGNFYQLTKLYSSIRFEEKTLPPDSELNQGRLQNRLDAISQRSELVSPEWMIVSRALIQDPRSESVLAWLLSEHATAERLKNRPPASSSDADRGSDDAGSAGRDGRYESERRGGFGGRGRDRDGPRRDRDQGRDQGRDRDRGRDAGRGHDADRSDIIARRDAGASSPSAAPPPARSHAAPGGVDGSAPMLDGEGRRTRDRSRRELTSETRTPSVALVGPEAHKRRPETLSDDALNARADEVERSEVLAPGDEASEGGRDGVAVEGQSSADQPVSGTKRRRRRRRKPGGRALAGGLEGGADSAGVAEPSEGGSDDDDDDDRDGATGDSDDPSNSADGDDHDENAEVGGGTDGDAAGTAGGKRRRRRRRRKPGAAAAQEKAGAQQGQSQAAPVQSAPQRPNRPPGPRPIAIPPPVVAKLSQEEILIDIDEGELEVVRGEFGEIDELDEFTLMGRRRGLIDDLQDEVVLEDLSGSDARARELDEAGAEYEDDPATDEAGLDSDRESSDGGSGLRSEGVTQEGSSDVGDRDIDRDGDDDGDDDGARPARGTESGAGESGDKRRRRRRKKKAAPPQPPKLTAPPHKDFWEVWAGATALNEFSDEQYPMPVEPPPQVRPAPQLVLSPRARMEPATGGDPEPSSYIAAVLNLGRQHGLKSADVRVLLEKRAGLQGRAIRDLTVRETDTLLRVDAARIDDAERSVTGSRHGDTLVVFTRLTPSGEATSRQPVAHDSSADSDADTSRAAQERPAPPVLSTTLPVVDAADITSTADRTGTVATEPAVSTDNPVPLTSTESTPLGSQESALERPTRAPRSGSAAARAAAAAAATQAAPDAGDLSVPPAFAAQTSPAPKAASPRKTASKRPSAGIEAEASIPAEAVTTDDTTTAGGDEPG